MVIFAMKIFAMKNGSKWTELTLHYDYEDEYSVTIITMEMNEYQCESPAVSKVVTEV